jgi:hypothetical protein
MQSSFELTKLTLCYFFDIFIRNPEHPNDLGVEDARSVGGDRANAKLLVPGSAELAGDHHIERRTERTSNLTAHRDTTARDRQDDRIFLLEMWEKCQDLVR